MRSCSARTVAGRDVDVGRHEAPHGRLGQPAQRHAGEAPLALERLERRGERVAAAEAGAAVGEDDQQPHVRRRTHQVGEQQQRGAVGVVQVLERDEQLALAHGGADELDDGVEQAQPLLLGVGRRVRGARRDLRRAAVAGEPADVVEHGCGQTARGRDERSQRAAPRAVRARLLARAAADHGGAAGAGLGGGLVDEPRLADPGLARYRDDVGAASARGPERSPQARELGVAADERVAIGGDRDDGHAGGAAEPVERVAHLRGIRRPVPRRLGEQRQHQRVERSVDAVRVPRGRLRRGVPVLCEQRCRVRAEERRAPAEQLPQRRAERVEVALGQRRPAGGLLGRLVVRRARRAAGALGIAGRDGDAEVAQPGAAVRREPDVVGLDVAVHDAVLVRMGERVGQRPARAQDLGDAEPLGGRGREPGGERAACHEARHDVQRTAILDRVVDGHDVRVISEARHQARLAPHPLARLGAGGAGQGARDRDGPVERQVVREPDLLGSAATEHPLWQVAIRDQLGGLPLRRSSRLCHGRAGRAPARLPGQRAAAGRAAGGGDVDHRSLRVPAPVHVRPG